MILTQMLFIVGIEDTMDGLGIWDQDVTLSLCTER